MAAQINGQDFEECYSFATDLWNQTLSVVQIEADASSPYYEMELIKFYTGLYHSFTAPTAYNEVDSVIHLLTSHWR